ncbi:MAG: DUF1887 family CARF protein [Bacteroidota bacterium]
MAKVLVSLVGNQAINNIRFIKEFKQSTDVFVFISTTEMEAENKTTAILNALDIAGEKVKKVIVSSYKFDEIEDALNKTNFSQNDDYLINITGGTKPMSIGVITHFLKYTKAKMFYVPIGEGTYRQVHPRIEKPETGFEKYTTLKEYLESYNLKVIEKESRVSRNIRHAEDLMKDFISYNGDVNKIEKIRKASGMSFPEDRSYYSGRWFEEYVFSKIKGKFKLNENQIAYGVQLLNDKAKNEYDAVFIYNDTIYIVECKAYFGKSNLREKVGKDLYKLGALDDDFGLKATSIYITTADIKGYNQNENNSLQNRADALKVKFFQQEDLVNDSFLEEIK